jgi:hypothetical protein
VSFGPVGRSVGLWFRRALRSAGQSRRLLSPPQDRPRSDFLISVENDLALFGVSGQFVNQPRMGFRVVESELF